MTKTIRKTTSTLLAVLLTAGFVLVTLLISLAEDASGSHVFEMAQIVEGTETPESFSANYAVIPDKAEYPLPIDEDGKPMDTFSLSGNSLKEGSLTFTEPGTYQYTAGKLKDGAKAPFSTSDFEAGTKTKPLTHIFGYKVERNADGTFSIIAYTCEDPTIKLHSDGKGMTVYNYLTVEEPGPAKPDEPAPAEPVTNDNNQPVTNKNNTIRTTVITRVAPTTVVQNVSTVRGSRVNTGDPQQLALWVGILAAASIGVILVFIAKRKKDDEENQ